MQWIKVIAIVALVIVVGAAAWWLQAEFWSAAGFGLPWWGYVAFWGAMALVVIVLKLTGPKDEGNDDGLPRPPGIG